MKFFTKAECGNLDAAFARLELTMNIHFVSAPNHDSVRCLHSILLQCNVHLHVKLEEILEALVLGMFFGHVTTIFGFIRFIPIVC